MFLLQFAETACNTLAAVAAAAAAGESALLAGPTAAAILPLLAAEAASLPELGADPPPLSWATGDLGCRRSRRPQQRLAVATGGGGLARAAAVAVGTCCDAAPQAWAGLLVGEAAGCLQPLACRHPDPFVRAAAATSLAALLAPALAAGGSETAVAVAAAGLEAGAGLLAGWSKEAGGLRLAAAGCAAIHRVFALLVRAPSLHVALHACASPSSPASGVSEVALG